MIFLEQRKMTLRHGDCSKKVKEIFAKMVKIFFFFMQGSNQFLQTGHFTMF